MPAALPPADERHVPAPPLRNAVAQSPSRGGGFSLGAAIESVGAIAPTPLLGAAAFAEVDVRHAPSSPWLRLTIAFASSSPLAGTSPAALYVLAIARASACPVGLALGPNLGALPCVDVGAGLVHASGENIAFREVANVPWAEAGATAVVRWRPGGMVFVDGAAGALVPITRPTFVFDTPRVVLHEVRWIGAKVSLAIGARIW